MNIQQIGPDRLRILLDTRDLDKYDLDYYSISKESPGTKRLLKEILFQAKKSGFDAYRCKILIEVLPGKSSGCILYLTKSAFEKQAQAEKQTEKLPAVRPPALRASALQAPAEKSPLQIPHAKQNLLTPYCGYVLSCDCLEDIISAIGHFADYADLPMRRSTLYSYSDRYYLVFLPVNLGLDRDRLVALLAALSEYGDAENCTPVREAILAEHGTTILKSRAVENFIRYFHV